MAAKIYTKTGDDGTTGLFGGQRVRKSSTRVNAYGTIDELNSYIGLISTKDLPAEIESAMFWLNNVLFIAGSDTATPLSPKPRFELDRINQEDITHLEKMIDEYTEQMPKLKNFILPGGTEVSALLQIARTVCRRAERHLVELAADEDLGEYLVKFFNRLSDYLFTAARYANFLAGVEETKWSGR